ncbi:uncharacterized protein LOC122064809 isoform X2 [Macadamia integrifolia]|nr:uncharacterized protein LOC122064809 isoform X2 [Macadamia integrifolia]XP_042484518.1 uncharacterized protein LOC122064809 isoform X2 [Macadamia integrifolia]XP_042484519.1 uncharacterized protein LOC122064809 isoform X2 [Macadamia integrifolia]XP_042484520.1 uncharacterized protein LOC122064809 isoform X2 [Macadamia integrifolia]
MAEMYHTNMMMQSHFDGSSSLSFLNDVLHSEMDDRLKTNSTFTKVGWDNITKGLEAEFKRPFAKVQLRNKMNKLRKEYNSFRALLETTGFGWDANARTAIADDSVWESTIQGNKDWAKYRRNGLPLWPELLEIFSDSSARGDRGLSQATVVTPTSTNLEIDDDLHDTDNDDSDACTGTPKGSALPKRRLDRTPTDRRRKSHTRTLTNSAEDFRTFVRWRMKKGSTSATSAVTRPPNPIVDGPYSMMSCQKLLDSLEDIPMDLYVLAQRKIHSDPGWCMSFIEVRPDRRLWMLHGLKE